MELKAIKNPSYNLKHEAKIQHWIAQITGYNFEKVTMRTFTSFYGIIRDGRLLCRFIEIISPGILQIPVSCLPPVPDRDTGDFVGEFLSAISELGVDKDKLFSAKDLSNMEDLNSFVECMFVLSDVVQEMVPSFPGPFIASKASHGENAHLKIMMRSGNHHRRRRSTGRAGLMDEPRVRRSRAHTMSIHLATAWDGQYQNIIEEGCVIPPRYGSARSTGDSIFASTVAHWTQILALESSQYMSKIFSSINEDRRKCMTSCIPPIEATDIIVETMAMSSPNNSRAYCGSLQNSLQASKLLLSLSRMHAEFGEGGSLPWENSQLENSKVIGEGCFGKVLEGTYDGEQVVVKILKIPELKKNARSSHIEKELLINLSCELSVLKYFGESHPNLVHFKGAIAAGGHMMMVMGLADRGDLQMVLRSEAIAKAGELQMHEDVLTWKLKVEMACGIANGLMALHGVGLVHRDIKDTNILVGKDYNCQICDHGFIVGAECESRLETCAGTQHFMAPEMELGCDFNQSADCFSLGITLCGMIASKVPGEDGFLVRTPRNHFEFLPDEFRGAAPHSCPQSFVDLCTSCCAYEPEARPSAQEIYEWLEDMLQTDCGGT